MKVQIEEIEKLRKDAKSPIFDYCRQLIKDGVHPRTSLKAYRGDVLCLSIKTIKQGAGLTVEENKYVGPRFRKYEPFSIAGKAKHEGKITCPLG